MSALLCRAGTLTADSAQVERLQRSLQQRNSEMRSLLDKIYRLEEEKKVSFVINYNFLNVIFTRI